MNTKPTPAQFNILNSVFPLYFSGYWYRGFNSIKSLVKKGYLTMDESDSAVIGSHYIKADLTDKGRQYLADIKSMQNKE